MRSVINALGLGSLTAFWSSVAVLGLPWAKSGGLTKVAQIWSKQVTRFCGVDVEIEGEMPEGDAFVVLANHTSHFDVLSIYSTIDLDMRPVAKRELGYIPIFGWVLAAGAAIMIDRGSRDKAIASIEKAAETIRGGRSVLMFPEGTRTPPGTIGEMKKGPFHLALAAQVPIVPVGVVGTGEVLLPGDWKIHPGKVRIKIGAPIPTAGLADTPEDRAKVMEAVKSAFEDLTKVG